jgi:hypothetical protein
VTTVDDQGRMRANPALIRSEVFPYDDLTIDAVAAGIQHLAAANCIVMYEVEGREIIQILNWWKYQDHQWAQPSMYPAPPGWIDRVKTMKRGRQFFSENWDLQGGFLDDGGGLARRPAKSESDGDRPEPKPVKAPKSQKPAATVEQPAAEKPAKAEKPAADPTMTHPAVVKYRELARLTPRPAQRDAIIEAVTDCQLWETIVRDWIVAGYDPLNFTGMLRCYREGKVEIRQGTKGQKPNAVGRGSAPMAAAARFLQAQGG